MGVEGAPVYIRRPDDVGHRDFARVLLLHELHERFSDQVARSSGAPVFGSRFHGHSAAIYKTQSLASADYLSYDNDNQELVVEKLLKDGDPANGGDELRARVASWSLYDKALVSLDMKLTTIVISPNVSDEKVLGKLSAEIENRISRQMFQDLGLLVSVVIGVVPAIRAYHVQEYADGRIVLEPRELVAPFELSKKTLATMDESMNSYRRAGLRSRSTSRPSQTRSRRSPCSWFYEVIVASLSNS